MTIARPKFDAPPVIETVLSVQFTALPAYSTAHAGWFWKEYLEKLGDGSSLKWSQAADAPRLEDQFERFGVEDIWVPPLSMKVFSQGQTPSLRSQFIRSDGERMIQVQNNRFILNWKKQNSAYPSYDALLPEFRIMLNAFEAFSLEAGFGAPQYNQWEITYVDQLKKGEMWHSAQDWTRIFPGLSAQLTRTKLLAAGDEVMSGDWRFSLTEQRGRLYISARQVRLQPGAGDEFLNVTLTCRGPVSKAQSWNRGLDVGHEALSETFLAITSEEAQRQWKRRG